MATKSIKVPGHRRSVPSSPAWPGPGRKPGPKTVPVDPYIRKNPSK
jgi:hypothetical protein